MPIEPLRDVRGFGRCEVAKAGDASCSKADYFGESLICLGVARFAGIRKQLMPRILAPQRLQTPELALGDWLCAHIFILSCAPGRAACAISLREAAAACNMSSSLH